MRISRATAWFCMNCEKRVTSRTDRCQYCNEKNSIAIRVGKRLWHNPFFSLKTGEDFIGELDEEEIRRRFGKYVKSNTAFFCVHPWDYLWEDREYIREPEGEEYLEALRRIIKEEKGKLDNKTWRMFVSSYATFGAEALLLRTLAKKKILTFINLTKNPCEERSFRDYLRCNSNKVGLYL